MNIIKRIKRIWHRFKNSDPIYNCPVYKNKGCAHVDGPICIPYDCDIINKYMGSTWVNCISCQLNNECCSKHYGLGCHNGIRIKHEYVACEEIVDSLRDIFIRHDKMIREEIENEIKKLKDEIKTL